MIIQNTWIVNKNWNFFQINISLAVDGVVFQVYHNVNLFMFYLCLEPHYFQQLQYTLYGSQLTMTVHKATNIETSKN